MVAASWSCRSERLAKESDQQFLLGSVAIDEFDLIGDELVEGEVAVGDGNEWLIGSGDNDVYVPRCTVAHVYVSIGQRDLEAFAVNQKTSTNTADSAATRKLRHE